MIFAFEKGDWVKITREGMYHERLAAIVSRKHLSYPKPTNMYELCLIEMPDVEIMLPEADLISWVETIRDKSIVHCECGGDKLEIPHHYSWCPKGKS